MIPLKVIGRREGELFIDHRASPGLTEEVARISGYDPNMVKEGKVYEVATLTCSHCKNSVVKNPFRTRPRENCSKCGNHYICDFCYADMQRSDYVHTSFEKHRDAAFELAAKGVLGTPHEILANIKETI